MSFQTCKTFVHLHNEQKAGQNSEFIKKILICVQKMNKSFTGLE